MSHHYRQTDAFTSAYEQTGSTDHNWRHQASLDAYEPRGYHHSYRRHPGDITRPHGEYSHHLPEFGLKGHLRHRHHGEGQGEGWGHHYRRHHGRINRSMGGDETSGPGGPQNFTPNPFGDNSGFPGMGDQSQDSGPSYGRNRGGWDQSQATPERYGRRQRESYGQPQEGYGQTPEYQGHGTGRKAEMAQIVAQHASEIGLSRQGTVAAVAAMLQESGGDPNKPGDFGKRDRRPHSFGLFQLNFRGGEGTEAGITPNQALDPHTNTQIALRYFKKFDGMGLSAGKQAKFAQNPGDKHYVDNVNRYVPEAQRLLGYS